MSRRSKPSTRSADPLPDCERPRRTAAFRSSDFGRQVARIAGPFALSAGDRNAAVDHERSHQLERPWGDPVPGAARRDLELLLPRSGVTRGRSSSGTRRRVNHAKCNCLGRVMGGHDPKQRYGRVARTRQSMATLIPSSVSTGRSTVPAFTTSSSPPSAATTCSAV